jgi:hypothetical protein
MGVVEVETERRARQGPPWRGSFGPLVGALFASLLGIVVLQTSASVGTTAQLDGSQVPLAEQSQSVEPIGVEDGHYTQASGIPCEFEEDGASANDAEPPPMDGPVSDCVSAPVDVAGPTKEPHDPRSVAPTKQPYSSAGTP